LVLVKPIKKTQEQRYGRAFGRRLSLAGVLPGLEPERGGLFVKSSVKG
jgi:hypothetical protein